MTGSSSATSLVRSFLGDELALRGESVIGVGGKDPLVFLITVAGVLLCCGLCLLRALCRVVCGGHNRHVRHAIAPRARARPVRVTEEELDYEDEILGDDDARVSVQMLGTNTPGARR